MASDTSIHLIDLLLRMGSAPMWHVHHAVATDDWKRNAGAGTLLRRTPTRTRPGTISGIELNIEPWAVPVGPQQLLLLPDRLLVWDGHALAGLPYDQLQSCATSVSFIEEGVVAHDAQVIDTTWQYVNKNGSPDRRFAHNRQLPVVQYGELSISSHSGLRIFLQTSTVAAAYHAAHYLSELSARARLPVVPAVATTTPALQVSGPSPTPHLATPALEPAAPTGRAELPRHMVAPALMIVIRSLAGADRRIDAREIEAAFNLHCQLTGSTDDLATFTHWFRKLSANDVSMVRALGELASASLEMKRWILERLQEMTLADGKQTPKESERLSEIRTALED